MFNIFNIWGIKPPELKTGDTLKLQNGFYMDKLLGYDKSYSPFGIVFDNGIAYASACRELLNSNIEDYLKKNTKMRIAFRYHELNANNPIAFFNMVNEKLGAEAQVKVFLTENKEIVVIDASEFWFKSVYRHAMLSLMIRMACVHYTGDLDKAINNYELAKKVAPVIHKFLNGFVCEKSPTVGLVCGLVHCYKGKTDAELDSFLKKA